MWPSVEHSQTASQHLDIGCRTSSRNVAAEEQDAVLTDHQPQERVRVMLDPDGHPICLC